MQKQFIFFDFAGTLVRMRPARLSVKRSNLIKLREKYCLGIITGAGKSETMNILNKLKIYDLFSLIITKDDSNLRKPNAKLFPNSEIAFYIGDTKKDELLARNANVAFFRVNKKYNINDILQKII